MARAARSLLRTFPPRLKQVEIFIQFGSVIQRVRSVDSGLKVCFSFQLFDQQICVQVFCLRKRVERRLVFVVR